MDKYKELSLAGSDYPPELRRIFLHLFNQLHLPDY
jgi:hypothetical protein